MTGKNCRQFRLLFPLSFIGQFVHTVGVEGIGEGDGWKGWVSLS